MAGKKGNGHDQTTVRMIEVLERIEKGVTSLRREVGERLDQTNARLDNLIAISGAAHRDHEARIERLESEMARVTARLDT